MRRAFNILGDTPTDAQSAGGLAIARPAPRRPPGIDPPAAAAGGLAIARRPRPEAQLDQRERSTASTPTNRDQADRHHAETASCAQ